MFTPLTLDLKQAMEEIRLKAGKNSSSHAFFSAFIWKEEMQHSIWLEPKGYVIRQGHRGEHCYAFVCGDEETKKAMLSALPAESTFCYADEQDLAFLQQWYPGRYLAQPARDDWEYLFNKQAQLDLDQRQYKRIRHSVNQVRNMPGWRIQLMDTQMLPQAKELEQQWQSQNFERIGDADRVAVANVLENYEALGFVGVLAYIDDVLVGYAIGGFLNEDTFLGIAQRATNPVYFSALRWELYHSLPDRIVTLNLEEDMGEENIRKNKMLMRPDGFHEMWDVTLIQN